MNQDIIVKNGIQAFNEFVIHHSQTLIAWEVEMGVKHSGMNPGVGAATSCGQNR